MRTLVILMVLGITGWAIRAQSSEPVAVPDSPKVVDSSMTTTNPEQLRPTVDHVSEGMIAMQSRVIELERIVRVLYEAHKSDMRENQTITLSNGMRLYQPYGKYIRKNWLGGSVVDGGGVPISGVTVKATHNYGGVSGEYTSELGCYLFDERPLGIQSISFSHPDHIDTTVSGVGVLRKRGTVLNVQMKPKPKKKRK